MDAADVCGGLLLRSSEQNQEIKLSQKILILGYLHPLSVHVATGYSNRDFRIVTEEM